MLDNVDDVRWMEWAHYRHSLRTVKNGSRPTRSAAQIPLLVWWVRGRLSRSPLRPRTGSHARTAGRIGRRKFLTSQPPRLEDCAMSRLARTLPTLAAAFLATASGSITALAAAATGATTRAMTSAATTSSYPAVPSRWTGSSRPPPM